MSVYELHLVESANANFTASVLAQLCDGFGIKAYELFAPAPPVAKRRVGRPRTVRKEAPLSGELPPSEDPPPSEDTPPSEAVPNRTVPG